MRLDENGKIAVAVCLDYRNGDRHVHWLRPGTPLIRTVIDKDGTVIMYELEVNDATEEPEWHPPE